MTIFYLRINHRTRSKHSVRIVQKSNRVNYFEINTIKKEVSYGETLIKGGICCVSMVIN